MRKDAAGSPIKRVWNYAPPKNEVNARRKAKRPYSHAERLEHERLVAEYVAQHGYRCQLCGNDAELLTVDHVQPYARGGEQVGGEKRVICDRCNKRRGARSQKYLRGAWGFRGVKGARQ